MKSNLYLLATALFIGIVFFLLIAILFRLKKALNLVGIDKPFVQQRVTRVVIILIGWLAFLGILALKGFFLDYNVLPPRFMYVLLPPLLFIAYLGVTKLNSNLLLKTPTSWFIHLQAFRVVMEIILWLLFLDNIIPVQMTFEGRNFDILVGLTAPLMGFMASRSQHSFTWGFIWNIAGLGLVFNIVIISILSTPFPFRVFMNEPANTIISYFPYMWLPGFVVPVAIALHVLSLKQLWLKARIRKNEANTKKVLAI